jgi:hypothetical protein
MHASDPVYHVTPTQFQEATRLLREALTYLTTVPEPTRGRRKRSRAGGAPLLDPDRRVSLARLAELLSEGPATANDLARRLHLRISGVRRRLADLAGVRVTPIKTGARGRPAHLYYLGPDSK